MYVRKILSTPRANFVYGLGYERETYSLVFRINPKVRDVLSAINSKNLYLRYAQERLHGRDFEGDILKNFGFGSVSNNRGIKDGCIELAFPLSSGVTISKDPCFMCRGEGVVHGDRVCGRCHGTKKEIIRNTDLRSIATSMYLLLSYCNSIIIRQETENFSDLGFQHTYLEIAISSSGEGRGIVLGGNISAEFISALKNASDSVATGIAQSMYECSLHIDGYIQHPNWEMTKSSYEYRTLLRDEGGFYLEVPGVNGCSFYLERGKDSCGCHNIDTVWQSHILLCGFAKLCTDVGFSGPVI